MKYMKTILDGKWGFDSNLIIYSIDKLSRFHKKSLQFMDSIVRQETQLCVTQQNIIEAERVFVVAYKYEARKVSRLIMDFIYEFNIEIIIPRPTTIYTFHTLLAEKSKQDIIDIYLAATYIDNDIRSLFTNNEKDFMHIPDFKIMNPFKLV